MHRVVMFDGEQAADRFNVLWEGLQIGLAIANTKQEGRGLEDRRRSVGVQRKLRAISQETGEKIALLGDEPMRALTQAGPTVAVELSQPEHDLVVKALSEPRIPWKPSRDEALIDTLDWLAAADKVETR